MANVSGSMSIWFVETYLQSGSWTKLLDVEALGLAQA